MANFGLTIGSMCGAKEAPVFTSSTVQTRLLVATQIQTHTPPQERTESLKQEDAFIAAVTFVDGYARDTWLDGRQRPLQPPQPAGSVALMDLRHDNQARFRTAVDSIQFYFPIDSLAKIAEANGFKGHHHIRSPLGTLFADQCLAQLATTLRETFRRPDEISQTFLDHLLMASALHFLARHADAECREVTFKGGLAPWQQRRVLEMLDANLDGALCLQELADSCQLSVRHFARAFQQSNGMPPYKWILQRRVDQAKQMLRKSDHAIQDVAFATGFASQSHFTRVFTQLEGVSPGQWRRQRRRITVV